MSRLRRTLVWLTRIRHCRGFGVQSPWAYRMVRYVINEHYPYYAYSELAKTYPRMGAKERKLCELIFRLANHVQPLTAVSYGISGSTVGDYVKAGCRRARYLKADGTAAGPLPEGVSLTVIAPRAGFAEAFAAACRRSCDGSVVMLLGIHGGKDARRLWRDTVRDMNDVVTFDLYYCGLVCFGKGRYKQNYIINF